MQKKADYLSVFQVKTCSFCLLSAHFIVSQPRWFSLNCRVSYVLKCYIKLSFKILSGLSDCLSRHQAVHNALSKSLPRCCWADQGSPRTCRCGGSSPAENPASWPCHCSSTPASPPQAQACQFHGSAGEIGIILLTVTFFITLGRQWYP